MEQNLFDLPSIFQIIKFGLENPNLFTSGNTKPIKVKEIRLCNTNVLLCEYYTDFDKSLDIKVEMAIVFGYFNGLFRNGDFGGWQFQSYAVSAWGQMKKKQCTAYPQNLLQSFSVPVVVLDG